MPLSWLPLISDYTRTAKKGIAASAISAATYMIVSCWMYIIGMGAAIFTGESDIAIIMSKVDTDLYTICNFLHTAENEERTKFHSITIIILIFLHISAVNS